MDLKQAIKQAGSGARGAKFAKIGQIIGGVVESAEIFQSRDDDGVLETWDDGSPKNKVRIIVQTNLDEGVDNDGREDDGRRALYVKAWGEQWKTLREAIDTAGLDDIPPGSKCFMKYVSDGPKAKKSWSAPKVYKFKVVAPPSVPVDDFDDAPEDEPAPTRRRAAAKPVVKPAPKATTRRRQPEPEPEPEDDDLDEDFDEEPESPTRRRAAVKPAAKPAAKPATRRRQPAPEPDEDLDDTADPVDDTVDALAAAGLDDDF